ncbi:hypothetical protein M5D96_000707 [Drosophila gunungcola]|uniref:Uncharacterized protein n=1 Tax=Drosophila gunungcola TaxID=103775 RepID=A0A9P9YWT5_9MUSC|nr:hypothetical protein M5D96_000707 [Drosophila gunungcola]
MPPAKDTFFQVAITTCLGMKVSAPTTPCRMSHMVRSRTSTPNRSVRPIRSRSTLQIEWFFRQFLGLSLMCMMRK